MYMCYVGSVTGMFSGEEAALWLQDTLHKTGQMLVRQRQPRMKQSGS